MRLTGIELFDCLYYLFLCICLSDLNRFLQSWIAMPLIFLCMAACGIFMIVTDLFPAIGYIFRYSYGSCGARDNSAVGDESRADMAVTAEKLQMAAYIREVPAGKRIVY